VALPGRDIGFSATHGTLLDHVGYWIALAASYLGLMSLWYYAAQSKIIVDLVWMCTRAACWR
jgi:hypothetical protein